MLDMAGLVYFSFHLSQIEPGGGFLIDRSGQDQKSPPKRGLEKTLMQDELIMTDRVLGDKLLAARAGFFFEVIMGVESAQGCGSFFVVMICLDFC